MCIPCHQRIHVRRMRQLPRARRICFNLSGICFSFGRHRFARRRNGPPHMFVAGPGLCASRLAAAWRCLEALPGGLEFFEKQPHAKYHWALGDIILKPSCPNDRAKSKEESRSQILVFAKLAPLSATDRIAIAVVSANKSRGSRTSVVISVKTSGERGRLSMAVGQAGARPKSWWHA
jgi:hypothetical protein